LEKFVNSQELTEAKVAQSQVFISLV
jgi:chromosome segregation ATPase